MEQASNDYPWSKMEHDERSMTFFGKKNATWEQMNDWLEKKLCKGKDDPHWKWRGFGEVGTENFQVVVLRMACDEYCGCESEDEDEWDDESDEE